MPNNVSSANLSYIQSQQILRQILPQNNSTNFNSPNYSTVNAQKAPVRTQKRGVLSFLANPKVRLVLSAVLLIGGVATIVKAGKAPNIVENIADNSKANEQLAQLSQSAVDDITAMNNRINDLQSSVNGLTDRLDSILEQKTEQAQVVNSAISSLQEGITTLSKSLSEILNLGASTDKINQQAADNLQNLTKISSQITDTLSQNSANTQNLSKVVDTLQDLVGDISSRTQTSDLTPVVSELQDLVNQLVENNRNLPNFDIKARQLQKMVQTLALSVQKLSTTGQNVDKVNAIAQNALNIQAVSAQILDELAKNTNETALAPKIAPAIEQTVIKEPIKPVNVIKKLEDIIFNSGRAFNKADGTDFSGTIKDVTPSGLPFEMLYSNGILEQAKHNGKIKTYSSTISNDGRILSRKVVTEDGGPIARIFRSIMPVNKKDRSVYSMGNSILDKTNNLLREITRFTRTGDNITMYEAVDGVYGKLEKANPNEIVQYNAYSLAHNLFDTKTTIKLQDGSTASWPNNYRLIAKTTKKSLSGKPINEDAKEIASAIKQGKGDKTVVVFSEIE